MDIKEAISPASEIMLSFTALDEIDSRLWKWTVHLENKVCFLKILTHGEVSTVFIMLEVYTSGFTRALSFRSPPRCGVDLSQKLVTR